MRGSSLTALRSLLSSHRSPLTAKNSPLKTHRSPLIAPLSPLTALNLNLILTGPN